MKLRLHDTQAEVAEATRRLVQVLEVVAVISPPYPDRRASTLVRVYLKVRLDGADPIRSTGGLAVSPPEPSASGAPPGGSPDPSRPATQARPRPRRELGGRWSQ